MPHTPNCPLCLEPGGTVLWHSGILRVIRVDDPFFPGFTRVVWREHVREMTDLPEADRRRLMAAVWTVERAQRYFLHPDKINLAQFGNMAPHLHWHVIPRWRGDSHFPEAVWARAPARSDGQSQAWAEQKTRIQSQLPDYYKGLVNQLDNDVS